MILQFLSDSKGAGFFLFFFCKRRDPSKDLKGLPQGWKNALGLGIQEKFHQKYTGMFIDLLRMVKKS